MSGGNVSLKEGLLRLRRGYATILSWTLRVALTAIALLGVGLAISMPLWYLAHKTPGIFDAIVIIGLAAAGSVLLVRSLRSGNRSRSTGPSAFVRIGSTLVVVLLIVVTLGALVLRGPATALVGAIALSGMIAWRAVPS